MEAIEETDQSETESNGGRLKKRLTNVKKRKQAQSGLACEVVVLKMRLVKTEEESDKPS